MRYVRYSLAAAATLAAVFAAGAKAERAPNAQPGTIVDACASDPDKLGVARVVEIDTTGGPQFGGSHGHDTAFLRDGEVILTFDDGPLRPYTRPVLKALAQHCTKATFFMVGRMAASDPAMVREVAAAGHTIGSHTMTHRNLTPTPLVKARQEFEGGVSAVTKANGGAIAPFFRFPYLGNNRQVQKHAENRNISSFWIDIDSKDFTTRDPKFVQRHVMSQLNAQRKGIILMHDIQPSTAGAIKGLLDEMRDKGFKVVHVVAKGQADTIASYDADADRELAAAEAKVKAAPLANRAMVYTMAPPLAAGAAGLIAHRQPAVKPAAARIAQRPTASDAAEEVLPWQTETRSMPPPPQPARAKRPPAKETLPWQPSLFGY